MAKATNQAVAAGMPATAATATATQTVKTYQAGFKKQATVNGPPPTDH